MQGLVSQAGKLNRFDLVQQISFLACQFQRGAARQVEGQEKSENIFARPCKGKNKSDSENEIVNFTTPLILPGTFGESQKNGNRFSRAMLGD